MKKYRFLTAVTAALLSVITPSWGVGGEDEMPMMGGMRDSQMQGMMRKGMEKDGRTSLKNPPMMREHHLSIMREHLEAVTEITGLISTGDYDKASRTAREKLGLTPEMRRMCEMMGDKQFTAVGLAFHQSADKLSEVLKKKDATASLAALHETLNLCVSCHASYRE